MAKNKYFHIEIGDIWSYNDGALVLVGYPKLLALILDFVKVNEDRIICKVWVLSFENLAEWYFDKSDVEQLNLVSRAP